MSCVFLSFFWHVPFGFLLTHQFSTFLTQNTTHPFLSSTLTILEPSFHPSYLDHSNDVDRLYPPVTMIAKLGPHLAKMSPQHLNPLMAHSLPNANMFNFDDEDDGGLKMNVAR